MTRPKKRSARKKTSRSLLSIPIPAVSSDQRLDILGVLLIGLALLTAVFLFKAEGESLPYLWILLLRRLFGVGAYAMPLVIAAPGMYMILRRFRASLPAPTPDRLAGIGLLFLGALVLAHLFTYPTRDTIFQTAWDGG
ncbi:MAG: hypothetical protein ACK2UB_06380, partial [Anaerolineales bacterium]